MLSWCGHSDISKGTGYTFNSQETRQEASLHKIASFICMSFKPLWTDVLGETATLLSLCYFCEMQYASRPSGTIWAASPHCLPQQALGQDPQLPVPTCDCIIWDAMSGKPRKRLEQNSPLAAKLQWCPSNFIQNLGSLFTPCLPQQLVSSFHSCERAQRCFLGRKSRGKAQSPAHACPASVLKEIIPSHLARARASHSLSGTRTGSQGLPGCQKLKASVIEILWRTGGRHSWLISWAACTASPNIRVCWLKRWKATAGNRVNSSAFPCCVSFSCIPELLSSTSDISRLPDRISPGVEIWKRSQLRGNVWLEWPCTRIPTGHLGRIKWNEEPI